MVLVACGRDRIRRRTRSHSTSCGGTRTSHPHRTIRNRRFRAGWPFGWPRRPQRVPPRGKFCHLVRLRRSFLIFRPAGLRLAFYPHYPPPARRIQHTRDTPLPALWAPAIHLPSAPHPASQLRPFHLLVPSAWPRRKQGSAGSQERCRTLGSRRRGRDGRRLSRSEELPGQRARRRVRRGGPVHSDSTRWFLGGGLQRQR